MKIVIIEDEELTALDLVETILKVETNAEIVTILKSVKEAVVFFNKNKQHIDLIFSDIQLGDGLSFEIFKAVESNFPVIFCTAFDEYALNAFKTNGIDYILKPFSEKSIAEAISKYENLKQTFSKDSFHIEEMIAMLDRQKNHKTGAVLVYYKDKIIPIKLEEVAVFYIENEITYILTFDNQQYIINKTLEEIEKIAPEYFYRTNRQNIVNRKAIKEASQYFARKLSLTLSIPFKGTITISKEKASDFLNWLSGN